MFHTDDVILKDREVFYSRCHKIVTTDSIPEKLDLAEKLRQAAYLTQLKRDLALEKHLTTPNPLGRYPYDLKPAGTAEIRPGRPLHFVVKASREMKKRQSLGSTAGLRSLLHSLAHIELCAVEIDAMMLSLYPHAPVEWILDWVSILAEEKDHFVLLCTLMKDLDYAYGDEAIHYALWETAMRGQTWLEQIAIVNRYQEAGGVDASHHLANKLRELGKTATATIIERLNNDEIRHVSLGTKWWNWAFSHYRLVGRESVSLGEEMGKHFFDIVNRRIPTAWKARVPLDVQGRRKSGFSQFEMSKVSSLVNKKSTSDAPRMGTNY